MTYTFGNSTAKEIAANAWHLFNAHAAEATTPTDPNPDVKLYQELEENGQFHAFTIKTEGKIVGYATFFATINLHTQKPQASLDTIYIAEKHRGRGVSFISYCENQLARKGIKRILMFAPTDSKWSALMKRKNYKHVENVFLGEL